MSTPDPACPPAPTPPEDPNPLRLAIETLEDTNSGDHGERVRRSHVQVPGETVEELVRRVFKGLGVRTTWARQHNPTDELVIRVMVNAEGDPTGTTEAPRVPSIPEPF